MMIEIDFLQYKQQLKIKVEKDRRYIFDPIRQKYLVLFPEEFVRQLVLLYLIQDKAYNKNRIKVEKTLKVNDRTKRCDILIYNKEVEPLLLVECKAPNVKITQETFKQIAWYNMPLQVQYLVVTNGLVTYCCAMDYEKQDYVFLEEIPVFE